MTREGAQSWRVRLAVALDTAERMHAPDEIRQLLLSAFNHLEDKDAIDVEKETQDALNHWHRWSCGKTLP